MAQEEIWDEEYRNPKFLSNSNEPQLDFKHFIKWLRKSKKVELTGFNVLDLGSGTGKNSFFLAERGALVTGIELSGVAIKFANERKTELGLEQVSFINGNIGKRLEFSDNQFDCILDVLSSNSLSEKELRTYLSEVYRVLKPDGFFFLKSLSLEGDKNAQNLLKQFPGNEQNTYIMPKTGITERVFTASELNDYYSQFKQERLEKKTSYTMFEGKPFKRNFWLVYMTKPQTD